MDERTNFVVTMNDLAKVVASRANSEIWRSSVMLRLLLLDKTPLVHRANRDIGLDIRFRVAMHYGLGKESATGVAYAQVGDGFDPESGFTEALKIRASEVDLQRLLKLQVVQLGTNTFLTVRELIKHMAHVHGPAHGGEPDNRKDEEFLAWRRGLILGGMPSGIRELGAVGRVVHRGLRPLYDVITSRFR